MTDTRTLKQVEKAVAQLRRKVAAAVRRHEKLQKRISTLQAAGSIIWMHKDAEIVAGDGCWYVKSDSLNKADQAGNWYYEVTCHEEHGYDCSCDAIKPCKHITTLSESFRAEALAVSERLQAELVLHQAEQFTRAIETSEQQIQEWLATAEIKGNLVEVKVGSGTIVGHKDTIVNALEWELWRKDMVALMHQKDAEQRATAALNSNQGFQLMRV